MFAADMRMGARGASSGHKMMAQDELVFVKEKAPAAASADAEVAAYSPTLDKYVRTVTSWYDNGQRLVDVESWYDSGKRLTSTFAPRAPEGWGSVPYAMIESEYEAALASVTAKTAEVIQAQKMLVSEQQKLMKASRRKSDYELMAKVGEQQKEANAAARLADMEAAEGTWFDEDDEWADDDDEDDDEGGGGKR